MTDTTKELVDEIKVLVDYNGNDHIKFLQAVLYTLEKKNMLLNKAEGMIGAIYYQTQEHLGYDRD